MGKQIPITTSFNLPDGREVVLETGKLAAQADGSVVLRMGDTMILATVVSSKEIKPGQSFFPLSVDYQEKFAAVGRVPGNFFRRETKLSDYEILVCRMVDRAIRPLFPDGYLNDTQVLIYLISADRDKDVMPDALAALAASAAIAVSDLPMQKLISEVRVARINGEFCINPGRKALKTADMDFIVAATEDDITMVEGESKECQEADLIEALKVAHAAIKVQIGAQKRLAELVGEKCATKRPNPEIAVDEKLEGRLRELISEKTFTVVRSASGKKERNAAFAEIEKEATETVTEEFGAEYMETWKPVVKRYLHDLNKEIVREVCLSESKRLDGRALDEVRPIWTEVDYLPASHGSAIFTRGETQALMSLTLGTVKDAALIDTALDPHDENFLLAYNFPPFSTGEVKPMRGPARREVGHANLAHRSLRQVMPDEKFPYTIRLVADILESNGSSSMATVCSGSMALMDGGVPIKAPVAGIAMGCIADNTGRAAVLSDILGDEDHLGDMDFKVTGTSKGITGCQMDIKIDGMPYSLLEKALEQARQGRIHILGEMAKVIGTPNAELKSHAPRVVEIRIDREYIGAVIGPGGKIVQEMQKETGTTISITEDENGGIVNIFGPNAEALETALARVRRIVFVPSVGDVWKDAVVETLQPYGVFVGYAGKSGLLHVSEMAYTRVGNVEDLFKVGDKISVAIVEVDSKTGKLRLSRKPLLEKPEGYVEPPAREERSDRGGYGGGRDDRRGGGDDRRGGGGDRGGRSGGGGFGGGRR